MKAKYALMKEVKFRKQDDLNAIENFMLKLNYVQKLKKNHGD